MRSFFGFFLITLLLAGCGSQQALHHPGEYVGMRDDYLSKGGDVAHQERLRTRFNEVQTDR